MELIPNESRRRTVGDLVDRYIDQHLPFKNNNKDAAKTTALPGWWKDRIGSYALANVNAALITEVRDELRSGKTYRGTTRSGPTVNRYLAAISHAFKIAVTEWHWINSNPVRNVGRYSESKGRTRWLVTMNASACYRPAGRVGTVVCMHWSSWHCRLVPDMVS